MNLTGAVDELFSMIMSNHNEEDDRYIFIQYNGRPNIRAKEIGLALYQFGGDAYMHEVGSKLQQKVHSEIMQGNHKIATDLRQLEFCWNGIGNWMA